MPALNADVHPDRCRTVGLVGTVAITAGGLTAGALPFRDTPPATSGRGALGLLCAYFGLVLLIAAWWWLGRAVRSARPPAPRELLTTLAVWAAPLLLGPPLFSRDVYSYLAQGAMVDARIDVYTHGPALLGGPLAAEVAPVWLHTPAPYGPVFLAVSARAADLVPAGLAPTEVSAAVLGMRLVALLGVGLMALCLPLLADRCGVPRSAALWLGALNPLVLLHLVAGAHNEALMLGLLGAGLVVALGAVPRAGPDRAGSTGRAAGTAAGRVPGARLLGATVLVTLAALVKVPAALGLLAVAALWSGRLTGRARVVRAGGRSGAPPPAPPPPGRPPRP
ncbi:polyprenol phosphomannose-dependent alpha 1,6 mannosyltransferase MptB, partial [Streptomyces sp. NPDC059134]|uniref:polyprenol phosphomannose-dependent alpha 1,6 mannosyltransferase MptB n=1 Tax=Streptomyces sp. NPDC059134 TaxID=3346738 RepID=UPI0036C12269